MFSIQDDQEKAALNTFRTKVEDLSQDDFTLIRFLRAREHNVDKAEEMLRKSVEWRRINRVSEFLNWKPSSPLFVDHSPIVFTGMDYEGCAVIYTPIGRWDTREKLEMGLKEDCHNYKYFTLETIMHHIRNCKGGKMTFIANLEGMTYWKVAHVETGRSFYSSLKTYEQNYPEILKAAYIINGTPWCITTIMSFLGPAFTGSTRSKIQIFNSDKESYLPELRKVIPEESIPRECLEPKGQ